MNMMYWLKVIKKLWHSGGIVFFRALIQSMVGQPDGAHQEEVVLATTMSFPPSRRRRAPADLPDFYLRKWRIGGAWSLGRRQASEDIGHVYTQCCSFVVRD
jgi:hypothetical protein